MRLCKQLGKLIQRIGHDLRRSHPPQVGQVVGQIGQLLEADDAGVVKKLQIAQDT